VFSMDMRQEMGSMWLRSFPQNTTIASMIKFLNALRAIGMDIRVTPVLVVGR